MKKKNIIILIILVIVAAFAVFSLVNLQNEKPENLEEYVDKTPEAMDLIESYCKKPVIGDKTLKVTIKENNIRYSLKLDEMEDYIMVQLEDQFRKFGKSMTKPFREEMEILRKESGFEDISVVLVIKDSDNKRLYRKIYR